MISVNVQVNPITQNPRLLEQLLHPHSYMFSIQFARDSQSEKSGKQT